MNTKKTLALTLLLSMMSMNFLPEATYAAIKSTKTPEQPAQVLKANAVSYINMAWWQNHNDEYLEDYITKALDNNQDLKIATLKVEESRQASKLQMANELPSLTVGASPSAIKMPFTTSGEGSFSIPIIASYEADIFLKNHDKTRSAKKLYEASKLQEKATYLSIVSAVGASYYNVVKLDKLIDIQEQIIKDRKQIFDIMKQSNEEGLVSTSDLVKANKSYVISMSDIIELKKSREIMLNQLAVLTGDSPENTKDFKRIKYDELNGAIYVPQAISSDIITQRPDYLVAEKMVEKSRIDVKVAKKEFLPQFNILGLMSFNTGGMFSAMNWENAIAGIAGAGMLQLFSGGAKFANLRMKKNQYEQILQNYYKTNLTAIQEVNDALSSLKLENEKLEKNIDALNMEKKDFKLTELKYKEGVIAYLDLLQKKENLLSTQKLVTASKIDCYVNQISLYKAVAGENI
ncbi:MAG: TolC family protein [Candidatus Gastranaerophilales bacterium]|nr:TolC family protein [Candidatus Gastranaerophilales bacterium]